jgi:hypothetical protein
MDGQKYRILCYKAHMMWLEGCIIMCNIVCGAGHYYLTALLLDTIKKTAKESGNEGRIVFTASEGHRITYKEGIDFHSLTDPALYLANPFASH